MPQPPDARRKLPVWHALSELFLDTELQPDDYARIAQRLEASGLAPSEIQHILTEEVAPAFSFNMIDVAGEWTPWSEEEVREIMARADRFPRPTRWLRKRWLKRYVEAEWKKIAPLLTD